LKYVSDDQFKAIYSKANNIERQGNKMISYLHNSKATRRIGEPTIQYSIDLDQN
jgi:hypothetical protein